MHAQNQRINHQPAFLLSTTPWRESSLLIELFSRDYGRVAMIARSARKRQSELRGVLVPFVPVSVSWYGGEELKMLHRAEWIGGWPQPQGQALFSGLYVNELLLRLTAREDAMPPLYDALYAVMQCIGGGEHVLPLRYFEWALLQNLGIAPDICQDESGTPVCAETRYWIRAEHAPLPLANAQGLPAEAGVAVSGATLLALHAHALADNNRIQQEALHLTRFLLDFRLPEGIRSRRILQQLQQLSL